MRLTRLDFLRGVAATTVILSHYRTLLSPNGSLVTSPDLPLLDLLWPLYNFGSYAVPFFWLLSGIVFMHTYDGAAADGRIFFWRRFARLYPLHFATLLAMAGLNLASLARVGQPVGVQNDVGHFALQLTMATHWFSSDGVSFNFPIWSVSMELLAYAAFFAFLRFTDRGWLPLMGATALATAIALGLANVQATCIALFFIGCLVIRLAPLSTFRMAFAGVSLAGLAVVGVALSPIVRHTALGVQYWLFPALLLVVAKIDLVRPPIRLEWVGNLSYGIYLNHVPLLTVVIMAIRLGMPNPARETWFLALFVTSVLVLSAATYRWIERPAQRAILKRTVRPQTVAQTPDW